MNGARLVALRKSWDLSQADVVRAMKVLGHQSFHQTTLSRIENDVRELRLSEAASMARIFAVSINRLAESGDDT